MLKKLFSPFPTPEHFVRAQSKRPVFRPPSCLNPLRYLRARTAAGNYYEDTREPLDALVPLE